VPHGFIRSPFGKMVTIDAPGAGTVPGANQGTIPESINIEGTIAGQYEDANDVFHCFLRYPDGHIVDFDAPHAGTGQNQGSLAVDINTEGTVAGYTIDENNVPHGFVRSRQGTFTSFDAPEAGKDPGEGTTVTLQSGLNSRGILIGSSIVVFNRLRGYVRERGGAVTLFDPTGSIITVPRAINSDGLIVGGAADANFIFHGFVRSVDGAITTFDVPGAGTTPGSFEGTQALGVSSFGLSTGNRIDCSAVAHGFVRYPNGAIFKFDAPGAGAVPGIPVAGIIQGTFPQVINSWGEVVGYFQDAKNVNHGFIRLP
jgi:hypothetical protein